jgi:hypothetical protein
MMALGAIFEVSYSHAASVHVGRCNSSKHAVESSTVKGARTVFVALMLFSGVIVILSKSMRNFQL